ncbi:hypothetical protein C8F01DRAFT_1255768 [Mycena amicta]|nr:hypothetical protein C8F01DRAFT_1255768 [Mycena amicta]
MSFNLLPSFALASIPPSCRSTSHCVTNIPNRHPNENSNISLKFGPGPSFKTPADSLNVPPQRCTICTTIDGAIVETDGHCIGIISSNHLPLRSMSTSCLGLFSPASTAPSSTSTLHCKNIPILRSNAPLPPLISLLSLVSFSPASTLPLSGRLILRSEIHPLPSMSPLHLILLAAPALTAPSSSSSHCKAFVLKCTGFPRRPSSALYHSHLGRRRCLREQRVSAQAQQLPSRGLNIPPPIIPFRIDTAVVNINILLPQYRPKASFQMPLASSDVPPPPPASMPPPSR